MTSQQIPLTDRLLEYLLEVSEPLPVQLSQAIATAAELDRSSMQISPDQAVLLRFLLRLIRARHVLEIGTFLGLSATVIADAIGPDGKLVCLDQSEEWTDHARRLWEKVGVSDRIELVVGDAHESVRQLSGEFDAVFIDADKGGYLDYVEQITPRLRSGGLLLVDNTLWYGRVVDGSDDSPNTVAIREFNRTLADDSRYEVAVTAIGDGFTLARKR